LLWNGQVVSTAGPLACDDRTALLALAWMEALAAAGTAETAATPSAPTKPAIANTATERIGLMVHVLLAVIGEHRRHAPAVLRCALPFPWIYRRERQ
jgi:hypothetical protein